jgi:hypothetical protein
MYSPKRVEAEVAGVAALREHVACTASDQVRGHQSRHKSACSIGVTGQGEIYCVAGGLRIGVGADRGRA